MFRIVKETDGNVNRYYVQRKKWYLFWIPVEVYYTSDFEDMPGWWTDHVNSEEQAYSILEAAKNSDLIKKSKRTVLKDFPS